MNRRPNVVIFLADDLGYSDIGRFGAEIRTPNLDRLADAGVRLSNFHNTPRCSPSRASLLTGLHPHQTGIGILANDSSAEGGYAGTLNDRCITMAEVLRSHGYTTAIRGKWHLSNSPNTPNDAWPTNRGFDSFYGTLDGCCTFYWPGTLTRDTTNVEAEAVADPDFFYTDAIADESVKFLKEKNPEQPYFLYVPFTAPHWPLHARQETIDSYSGVYDVGWDVIREQRLARQKRLGVIPEYTELSPRDASVPAWENEPDREWQVQRMQTYAAQVTEMDTAIGRVLEQIQANGEWDNTIIIFMSDNGACAEALPFNEFERFRRADNLVRRTTRDGRPVKLGNDPTVPPGGEDTYASYGKGWANVSNTPFRMYKRWTHEGGVAAPFIFHWPAGDLADGQVLTNAFQLVNVAPTIYEATGAAYPSDRHGIELPPLPADSMLSALRGGDAENPQMWWEHLGNAAITRGHWKLVREYDWDWELYDLSVDRNELVDVSAQHPDIVKALSDEWQRLAYLRGVIPYRKTLEIFRNRGLSPHDASNSG